MKTRTNSKKYKMLMWSIDYIKHHSDATTADVPQELMKFWAVPDFTTNPYYEPDYMQQLVFMYVVRLNHPTWNDSNFVLNSYHFSQLFHHFQLILAMTALCRKKRIPLEPFPVFDIRRYAVPDLSDQKELKKQYQFLTTP